MTSTEGKCNFLFGIFAKFFGHPFISLKPNKNKITLCNKTYIIILYDFLMEIDCFICEVQTEAEETTDFINISPLTREVQNVRSTGNAVSSRLCDKLNKLDISPFTTEAQGISYLNVYEIRTRKKRAR